MATCDLSALQIEALVRERIGRLFDCTPMKDKRPFGEGLRRHEFDIFAENIVIGGVSTSPYLNISGSGNTGGRDRAIAELFWLTLWPGDEQRLHVLTELRMAQFVRDIVKGVPLPKDISIDHYDVCTDTLRLID